METIIITEEYINHGIACRIGNTIFLNKKLKDYPELLGAIIQHELDHTSGLTLKDFILDFRIKQIKPFKNDYYHFILHNPSSWTEFLPFGLYKGKFVINPVILAFYGALLVTFGGIGWLFL